MPGTWEATSPVSSGPGVAVRGAEDLGGLAGDAGRAAEARSVAAGAPPRKTRPPPPPPPGPCRSPGYAVGATVGHASEPRPPRAFTREPAEAAARGEHEHGAAGAPAPAAVVVRRRVGGIRGQSVGLDRARAGERARPHHHDPAARVAAPLVAGRVVARAGAAAPAEGHDPAARRDPAAAEAADRGVAVPGVPAAPAEAAVAPAPAPGVLVVRGRVRVVSPAAGRARRAAGKAAVRVALGRVVEDVLSLGAVEPPRRPRRALALGRVVVRGGQAAVRRARAARLPAALLRGAAPEPAAAHARRRAAEGERALHVEGEDAPRAAVPVGRR